jgi:hypothetical protein
MLGKETCPEKRAQIDFSAKTQMAMEFAKTASAGIAGLMTPGCRRAPGVFC